MLRIMEEKELINFVLPEKQPTIIKVVGVGGGGGNAVNHMFNEGIRDVSYLICNTDQQVLFTSPIPDKLQLGPETTHGLGAGNEPAVAKQAAEEREEDIRRALGDSTKMVFITAGMGGGTGTGAAPVSAKISRSMDILTVGIVTIPFSWEGAVKINQAMDGVDAISKEVDALLVINNDLLSTIYPDMTVMNGFKKADDTLCTAAKSIAEIITIPGYINLDFADVKTVLKDGGVAVMSAGKAKGKNRVIDAMNEALRSPLLNNNDVFQASKILQYFLRHRQARIGVGRNPANQQVHGTVRRPRTSGYLGYFHRRKLGRRTEGDPLGQRIRRERCARHEAISSAGRK